MIVFVSTHPFSTTSLIPKKILSDENMVVKENPYGRKITSEELSNEIGNADILIAGTEKITENVLKNAPNLKLISRVGIGLDGIDFDLCKKYNVKVTYTPDAPSMAVAELTVGLMLDLARKISYTSNNLSQKSVWYRYMGQLLYGKTIGLFGIGRIGKSVVKLLSGFNVKIIAHDINPDLSFYNMFNIAIASKEEVLRKSDIVSIHIPLKKDTINYITYSDLEKMKNSSLLINTARGGIINEADLAMALKNSLISSAAVDVFEKEPYTGELQNLNNCTLLCHMGASTIESRTVMEVEAVQEAVLFKNKGELKNEVNSNG